MKARHEGTTFSYAIPRYTLLVAARSLGNLGHKGGGFLLLTLAQKLREFLDFLCIEDVAMNK